MLIVVDGITVQCGCALLRVAVGTWRSCELAFGIYGETESGIKSIRVKRTEQRRYTRNRSDIYIGYRELRKLPVLLDVTLHWWLHGRPHAGRCP